MPKCPTCGKEVYFAEKLVSNGKDYHKACHKCARCNKSIAAGSACEHADKLYCQNPCYATLFGPGGTRAGSGTAGSAKYD
ncbi:cysteine-rich protein 1-like [Haliotis cracherodii]|uniref:cysteine-rich protein 1-like n=1 Tax=Haliotis cracherodii TaxID=6455 RepID=UPI0039E81CD8